MVGIGWGMREWRNVLVGVLVAGFFAIILTMMRAGTTEFALLVSDLPLYEKLNVVGAVVGRIGESFWTVDGFLILGLSLMQGVLVGMLVGNWRERKRVDGDGIGGAGIAGTMAILGAGCTTCATSLLVPMMSVIFSSAAYAMIGVVSGVVMGVAFVIGLLALRRLGFLNYLAVTARRYKKAREK